LSLFADRRREPAWAAWSSAGVLPAALAAGATLREALEIASAAASIVIHQLGTTGTASVEQIRGVLATR